MTASATKTMCSCHTGFILCREKYADAVDAGVYPGVLASMHLQTVAAAAWAFKRATMPEFKELMEHTVKNAKALARQLEKRGFGILGGGTDCHMIVADLRPMYARYPEVKMDGVKFCDMLESVGISVNAKGIPYDELPSVNGIRLGCTVLSQRGMKEAQMELIAGIFEKVFFGGEEELARCREEVEKLCFEFDLSEM